MKLSHVLKTILIMHLVESSDLQMKVNKILFFTKHLHSEQMLADTSNSIMQTYACCMHAVLRTEAMHVVLPTKAMHGQIPWLEYMYVAALQRDGGKLSCTCAFSRSRSHGSSALGGVLIGKIYPVFSMVPITVEDFNDFEIYETQRLCQWHGYRVMLRL